MIFGHRRRRRRRFRRDCAGHRAADRHFGERRLHPGRISTSTSGADRARGAQGTLPVTRTSRWLVGSGYQHVKVSSRDAVRGPRCLPVIATMAALTDKAWLRDDCYDVSGINWDVGAMWRPSRRTSLSAFVGRRYGSMTYYGSFSYAEQPQCAQHQRVRTWSPGSARQWAMRCADCPPISPRSAIRSAATFQGCASGARRLRLCQRRARLARLGCLPRTRRVRQLQPYGRSPRARTWRWPLRPQLHRRAWHGARNGQWAGGRDLLRQRRGFPVRSTGSRASASMSTTAGSSLAPRRSPMSTRWALTAAYRASLPTVWCNIAVGSICSTANWSMTSWSRPGSSACATIPQRALPQCTMHSTS